MIRLTRAALLATLSSFALAAVPAAAQGTDADEDQTQTAEAGGPLAADETIIITGTRRTDRTLADSPVPVDVIGSEAITNSGQTETNKILNQLVPSFNFPQPSIADGSDALRPATLRGLSPDQTLVLVNGKRRHVSALLNINGTVGRGSAAVDLNLIPGLAISRVEVLRDGAAAQYGSDAIAGVINIQLKNASDGGRASATWGKYYTTIDDVANVTGLQLTAGGQPQLDPADNRYFLANTDGEREVHDGRQLTIGANIGIPLGPTASSTSPANIATATAPTAPASTSARTTTGTDRRALRSARAQLQPSPVPLRRPRHAGLQPVPQRRPGRRRRLGALCLRLLRPARRSQRRQLASAEQPAGQPRLQHDHSGHDADHRQFRAADAARFPAAHRYRPPRTIRRRSACAATSPAGTPICRSGTATTASTISSGTRSTPRSAPPARTCSTPAGCATARSGQPRFLQGI